MSVDVHEFSTGAIRSTDADNVRYDLISPIALDEIAKTYAEGSAKYGDHNWLKGMPVSDLLNHAIRHVYLFLSGDRSEPHLPHAAWGLMAAIHSYKQWPHLNGNLLRPGCTPPTAETAKAEPASPGGQADPLPPGIVRYPDHDSLSGMQSPYWGIDEWRQFCDYMRWSSEPPKQESTPPTAPRHHIPIIDDALNGLGPFPVLYISGPMSSYRDLNFPAFNLASEKLRRMGFPVLNPADFGACNDLSWEENLHRDLHYLGYADILVQLPGWADSRGASLEYNTAVALGKGVTSIYTLIGEWQ